MIRRLLESRWIPWLMTLTLIVSVKVYAEAVQWPAGQNVCQGVWSYGEYESCEDASHGQDKDRPITAEKDGKQCGFEKMKNSCWHGRKPANVIDTAVERLEGYDRDYTAQSLLAHCEWKARGIQLGPQQLLGTVSVLGSKFYPQQCIELEGKFCIDWRYRADVQCRINIDQQTFGPSADCGPEIDNPEKPKTCTVGYHNINKRSSACKSIDQKTGRSMNATELMKPDWRHSFTCSTGDELPAETAAEVQTKYNFLVKKIQETRNALDADFEILRSGLSTLLMQRSQHLDQTQIAYATKVTSREIRISSLSEGFAYDVGKECASHGSGQSRFCPSKRILFDFGEISHLPRITSLTSMAHRLRYSFLCDANGSQLSARLIAGDDDFSLAPTPTAVIQSTRILYLPGERPPQIEIIADRNAFLSDFCQLKVDWSSLDLDATLLLTSANDLIDKMRLLSDFKVDLDAAAQLPAKFSSIRTLKSNVADKITEDIFKCQDLAAGAGRDYEALCPLNDNPRWACANAPLNEAGELGVIIRNIRENSCLYGDLEEGLPESVPCATPGEQCLAGIQKVARKAAEEYQKSRNSADGLVMALTTERTRVAAKQADLARKIGIVIEAVRKGLAENPI